MENKSLKISNIEEEMFSNKYYFLSSKNNVVNTISTETNNVDLENIKKEYLEKEVSFYTSIDLINTVFFNKENKRKKLIIIDIEDERIVSLLESVLEDLEVIIFKDKMFIYYSQELEIELKRIYEAISFDFGVKFKMFFCEIVDLKYSALLHYLWTLYFKNKVNDFYSINDLVMEINRRNFKLIKRLRKVLLEKILIDQQLISLIKSMVENNLNISQSSKDLYMHRNTVNYKIEYIKKTTGFNIQKFKDAVCLYILLDL